MVRRKIKIIKQGETEAPIVTESVSAEETASDLETERRNTVKDWITEFRENDRMEKKDSESDLNRWRKEDDKPSDE